MYSQFPKMRWAALIIALLTVASSASGQMSGMTDLGRSGRPHGIQINSASVYAGGFSLQAPEASVGIGATPAMGWATELGWYSFSDKRNIAVEYEVFHDAVWKYSELNTFNHFLSVNYRTRIDRRLSFSVTANAESVGFAEYLFQPTRNSRAVERSDHMDAFTAGALGRASAGSPSVLLPNVAPLPYSPLTVGLSTSHTRSESVGAAFNYSASRRLSWDWGVRGTNTEPGIGAGQADPGRATLPRYMDAAAYGGFSYLLSRRTELGVELSHTRMYTSRYHQFTSMVRSRIEKLMGKRWLIGSEAGFAAVADSATYRRKFYMPSFGTYEVAGLAGYNSATHALLASVRRSAGDAYGLGASASLSTGLTWRWRPRGANWSFIVDSGYEKVTGGRLDGIQGWLVHATAERRITPHLSWTAEYVHSTIAGGIAGFTNLAQRGGRVSLTWRPGIRTLR
jgi:hypothetical protein